MTGILYPYNAEAYKAAAAMLDGCGKAAVVHPTGTGKSFIGFQLCRDHLAAKICWLSPSEYIFRTQLELFAHVHHRKPGKVLSVRNGHGSSYTRQQYEHLSSD